ncbi:hypothetical protein PR048_020449 [Dryococelus australis]|uniref:Uncharacterized protein n=1 Tax=Dryococelus australis TaxID=614101 RepID=A0ABQ9H6D4_9NEOP|nr:hypothetical protein PR048_020449 [Dryococelus australis]
MHVQTRASARGVRTRNYGIMPLWAQPPLLQGLARRLSVSGGSLDAHSVCLIGYYVPLNDSYLLCWRVNYQALVGERRSDMTLAIDAILLASAARAGSRRFRSWFESPWEAILNWAISVSCCLGRVSPAACVIAIDVLHSIHTAKEYAMCTQTDLKQGFQKCFPSRVTPDFLMWESCRMMLLVGGFSRRVGNTKRRFLTRVGNVAGAGKRRFLCPPTTPACSVKDETVYPRECTVASPSPQGITRLSAANAVKTGLDLVVARVQTRNGVNYTCTSNTLPLIGWRILAGHASRPRLRCGRSFTLIGCVKPWEEVSCLIGYCEIRKVRYWLGCQLASKLAGADWRAAFLHALANDGVLLARVQLEFAVCATLYSRVFCDHTSMYIAMITRRSG